MVSRLKLPKWDDLPSDIVDKISKILKTQIDILPLRSVCSSWRSSTPNLGPVTLQCPFPVVPCATEELYWIDDDTDFLPPCGLLESTLYVLRPRDPSSSAINDGPQEWLVKVEEVEPSKVLRLVNPLSRTHIKPLPDSFPKVLDLARFQICELGKEYVLQHLESESSDSDSSEGFQEADACVREMDNLEVMRVAVLPFENPNSISRDNDYVVLAIRISGELVYAAPGNLLWITLGGLHKCPRYHDILVYKGKFYAVDCSGRTGIVDSARFNAWERANVEDATFDMDKVAASIKRGGHRKRLVESNGDLFLVDIYVYFGRKHLDWDESKDKVRYDGDGNGMPHGFKGRAAITGFRVYKLDESKHVWVGVESLGDRVFMLGDRSSFSISASEFTGCPGNCILFTDKRYTTNGGNSGDNVFIHKIRVFDLEDGTVNDLAAYPGFNQLFWPPPSWVIDHNEPIEGSDGGKWIVRY